MQVRVALEPADGIQILVCSRNRLGGDLAAISPALSAISNCAIPQKFDSTKSPALCDFKSRDSTAILGSSKTWLFQTWLFVIVSALLSSSGLFCARLRSFALFCGLAFALFCAHLRSFALICVFLRPAAFRTTALGNCRDSIQRNRRDSDFAISVHLSLRSTSFSS